MRREQNLHHQVEKPEARAARVRVPAEIGGVSVPHDALRNPQHVALEAPSLYTRIRTMGCIRIQTVARAPASTVHAPLPDVPVAT